MSCCAAYRPMTSRWRAQRTHGTTDPGGVWHPVHRKECLTILLGTYAENGQIIATDDERIVFSTACLCLHWQPPILSFSGYGTIALERRGCTLSMRSFNV